MRFLLVLTDDAQRDACAEYFSLRGCSVATAGERETAQALLHFRAYDAVVIDDDVEEVPRLIALARRRNAVVVPVVLSTIDPESASADDAIVRLTKAVRLETIREAVSRSRSRGEASGITVTPW
jgi:DNA-binding NtrC family response regulator